MHFKINTDTLALALRRAQGVAGRKSTIPILANVLLAARDGELTVTAFDLDVALVGEYPAEVVKPGAITLPAKHLLDIVKALPEATVEFKGGKNNTVEVLCGSAHFKILGMPAEEYPALPAAEKAAPVKVSGRGLLELIGATRHALSTDESRYILTGLLLAADRDGALRAVATDGHRMALAERALEDAPKMKKAIIVPGKGLAELRSLLSETPDAESYLAVGDTSLRYSREGLALTIRLVDGVFPDYLEAVPKESVFFKVSRKPLMDTLRRIALLSDEKSHAVKLCLTPEKLEVTAQHRDLGEARDEVACDYDGPKVEAGFNATYLVAALEVLGGEDVLMALQDDSSPLVLTVAGSQQVVMPMRM